VGTFYALCKIYLAVGKYVGRLGGVFVNMQRAVVSLREVAALLNLVDQRSHRRDALKWQRILHTGDSEASKSTTIPWIAVQFIETRIKLPGIVFDKGVAFLRPAEHKHGLTFGELKLMEACTLLLGRFVHVQAQNERVLCSFLGLAAQVIHPTDHQGQFLNEDYPTTTVPLGVRTMMLPTLPATTTALAPITIEAQLQATGAPKRLCSALAQCLGLEPTNYTGSLHLGSAQVFAIARALLLDPDVLCACRPLALVPHEMRGKVAMILRLWQACGGLPYIAKLLGIVEAERQPYRSSARTLVIGNARDQLQAQQTDDFVDLDSILWKPEEGDELDVNNIYLSGFSHAEPVQCKCGNVFMADADFCRKCGKKRQEVVQHDPLMPVLPVLARAATKDWRDFGRNRSGTSQSSEEAKDSQRLRCRTGTKESESSIESQRSAAIDSHRLETALERSRSFSGTPAPLITNQAASQLLSALPDAALLGAAEPANSPVAARSARSLKSVRSASGRSLDSAGMRPNCLATCLPY